MHLDTRTVQILLVSTMTVGSTVACREFLLYCHNTEWYLLRLGQYAQQYFTSFQKYRKNDKDNLLTWRMPWSESSWSPFEHDEKLWAHWSAHWEHWVFVAFSLCTLEKATKLFSCFFFVEVADVFLLTYWEIIHELRENILTLATVPGLRVALWT